MKLWFENSYGKERIIKEPCDTWEDVNLAIDEFIADCNDKYPLNKKNPFVRYYTRVWQMPDGRTKLDVGSHTEFFIWEGKFKSATIIDKDGEVEFEYE